MLTLVTKEHDTLRVLPGAGESDVTRAAVNPLWLDVSEPTKAEGALLASLFHFHPLAIEDCWEQVNHPKVDDYGNVLFLVFHEPVYRDGRFTTRETEFFLGRRFLVTFHQHKLVHADTVLQQLAKRPELFDRGSDFLLYLLLDEIVDNYFPILDKLESRIDGIEDAIVKNPTKQTVNSIFALKREVLHLKKVIGPQREILNRFTRGEFPQVPTSSVVYFRDLYDHIYRIYDLAESFRDLLSGALDAYLSALSNRMNEIMKVLTIITTILLPLTLIVGIYGMNFKFMPELKQPWGYPAVIVFMFIVAMTMVRFFRKKRWI